MIHDIVAFINNILWGDGQILIYMLLLAGIWFTWRLRLLQVIDFKHMFSLLKGSTASDSRGISSFQALCTSLSARVGTGNLAGVAVAISLGGAGAVFWMWVIAFVGMATAFAESLLGQLYKEKDALGNYRGGPAYYMRKGLNSRFLAITFSLCLFFGYGFVFSSVQANSITDAFSGSFGVEPIYTGICIAILTAWVVLGGLKNIARFSEIIVPFMGVAYLVICLVVMAINIEHLPGIFALIVKSALGLEQAGGGLVGAAIVQGVKRGLYSNEAGMGSAPNVAAAATTYPSHPASQGYIQMLAVFFDTIIICTCTACLILLFDNTKQGIQGIQLTQQALASHVGAWGSDFITIAILFFGFTSIIASFAYAETNLKYLRLDTLLGHWFLRIGFLFMLIFGSVASLPQVIALADLSTGVMTIINVTALFLLSKVIIHVTKDYHQQMKNNTLPSYQPDEAEKEKFKLTPKVW